MKSAFTQMSKLGGTWEGTIQISDILGLRVALRVRRMPYDKWVATLDSLDQGVHDINLTSITLRGHTVQFAIQKIDAEFVGKLNATGTVCSGEWIQRGRRSPLILTRVDASSPSVSRPQTPRRPFPYREEQVSYTGATRDIQLAGTLTLPQAAGRYACVVLISGSGALDRDCTAWGHKPFLVLSDVLTRGGIATLRVDDRGIGGSTGSLPSSTLDDLASDVSAGIEFLKSRSEIEPTKIGLLGHSAGGLVGALAASQYPDLAFLVLLATPGLCGGQILEVQRRLMNVTTRATAELNEWQENLISRLLAVLDARVDDREADSTMRSIVKEEVKKMPGERRVETRNLESSLHSIAAQMRTPWFRSFLAYDPLVALSRVRCPVLVLNGELDVQVPPHPNLKLIKDALERDGNSLATVAELAGLNHLLQRCKRRGDPSEYGEIQETIAPFALDLIKTWILEQLKRLEVR